MMLLIYRLEPVQRQVRVHLCGRDIRMAQDGLNRTQVSAIFDHVRGTTVP